MDTVRQLVQELVAGAREVPEVFYQHAMPSHWPEVVGEKLLAVTRPGTLTDGRLVVRVKNSYWKTHLAGMEKVFLEAVSRFVPPGVVREVIFRASPEEFVKLKGARRTPPSDPLSEEARSWVGRCAGGISHPALREVFSRAIAAHAPLKRTIEPDHDGE